MFLSSDAYERSEAFHHIQEELDYMVKLRPVYILFHYSKPVILGPRADWSNWRFADRKEYIYEGDLSLNELIQHSRYLF